MQLAARQYLPPETDLRSLPSTLVVNERTARGVDASPERLGIALSGGGTKAAAFSLGALQGLIENGLFGRAEYLSTVSGGSYAGFYLYSRLASASDGDGPIDANRVSSWFADCLPERYAPAGRDIGQTVGDPARPRFPDYAGEPPHEYTRQFRCTSSHPGWLGAIEQGPYQGIEDPWRYQNYLRANQDVLVSQCDLRSTEQTRPRFNGLIGWSLLTAPMHLAMGAFDWRTNTGISKWRYIDGLHTVYGAEPEPIGYQGPNGGAGCRPRIPRAAVPELHFAQLRKLQAQPVPWLCGSATADCKAPVWLINATASATECLTDTFCRRGIPVRSAWGSLPNQPELNRTVYTFSPYGYGSASLGHVDLADSGIATEALPVGLAVSASGAFIDYQQHQYGFSPWTKGALVVAILRSGVNWGTDIANPARVAHDPSYRRAQAFHSALPWPLYLAHGYRKNLNALSLHLSDGGQSENTGIFALLQRGASRIIFVDAAADGFGDFGDLCVLDHHLRNGELPGQRKLALHFDDPELERRYQSTCFLAQDQAPWKYKRMRSPERFCMPADRTVLDPLCNLPQVVHARFRPADPAQADQSEVVLHIVKPMLDVSPKARSQGFRRANGSDLPEELVGFLGMQEWREGKAFFPQLETPRTTANFSAWLYGAYRELGRHITRQIPQ